MYTHAAISFSLVALHTISVLTTPKFNSLAQTSPPNNIVMNSPALLSLPLGWLSDVPNVRCPKLSTCCPDLDLLSPSLPLFSNRQLHSSCCSGQKHRNHPASLSLTPHMQFSNSLDSAFKLHPESNLFLTTCFHLHLHRSQHHLLAWITEMASSFYPCATLLFSPQKLCPSRRLAILCHTLDEYPSVASYLTQNKTPNPYCDLQEPLSAGPHLSL